MSDGGTEESLIEYPCDFPIKVMGRSDGELETLVRELVTGVLSAERFIDSRSAASSAGRFVSVTVTVRVEDRAELDAVYAAFTGHDDVLMVL